MYSAERLTDIQIVMRKPSLEPFIETERRKNDLRSSTRQLSKVTANVIRSCQSCDPEENFKMLNHHIAQLESSKSSVTEARLNHLRGLRAVLQMLLASYSFEDAGMFGLVT